MATPHKQDRPGKPPRLAFVFQDYQSPLYYVTICVQDRHPVLTCDTIHAAFIENAGKSQANGNAVGRYVLMPDHIHLFVSVGRDTRLTDYVRFLKADLKKACRTCVAKTAPHRGAATRGLSGCDALCSRPSVRGGEATAWDFQDGFFDHLIRHSESYTEKWNYVRDNPVRAQFVETPDEWPYQGEITPLQGCWQS